jgi:hypothetical protein
MAAFQHCYVSCRIHITTPFQHFAVVLFLDHISEHLTKNRHAHQYHQQGANTCHTHYLLSSQRNCCRILSFTFWLVVGIHPNRVARGSK